VPMITMGRLGSMIYKARPADDAIIAMFNASKNIIHMALQDLGPCCFPNTKTALPGCVWPKKYLQALARAIYERGVDVEIALSNPGSIPGGLGPTEALYGNGWSCNDVASEIVKAIRDIGGTDDEKLRVMVQENLRLCFIRQGTKNTWNDDKTMGMHAKHFIIDDTAYYIGSQNLYVCDLAEWGILIDDKKQTQKCMNEYWNQMWENSYKEGDDGDCDVDKVMDGLDVNRDGASTFGHSRSEREQMYIQAAGNVGSLMHRRRHTEDSA